MKRIVSIVVAMVMLVTLSGCSAEQKQYKEAIKLYEDEQYEEALSLFTELGDYKDSQNYASNASQEAQRIREEELIQRAESISSEKEWNAFRHDIYGNEEDILIIMRKASPDGVYHLTAFENTYVKEVAYLLHLALSVNCEGIPEENMDLLAQLYRSREFDGSDNYEFTLSLKKMGFTSFDMFSQELQDEFLVLDQAELEKENEYRLQKRIEEKCISAAIGAIKDRLKRPSTFKSSSKTAFAERDETNSTFETHVIIGFTAENSFGDTVKSLAECYVEGTYNIDNTELTYDVEVTNINYLTIK